MKIKCLSLLAAAFAVTATASWATVLTFHIEDGSGFQPSPNTQFFDTTLAAYGDNVSSTSNAIGGGFIGFYGIGNGFTPNVVVDYTLSPNANHQTAYQDGIWSGGVDYLDAGSQSDWHDYFTFTPDSFFGVRVNSFDLFTYAGAPLENQGVTWTLFGGSTNGTVLATGSLIVSNNPNQGVQTILTGLSGFYSGEVVLDIHNTSGSGTQLGLDNLNFDQVPEPSTVVCVSLGGMVLLWRRRNG